MWSCCPSWLWSLSCCPWQCWIQRAFLGSNVFQYWQTRSETNTWSTRVNRINLLKSENWLLPRIGRHHGASCRGCWYRPTTLPVNCRRSKSWVMGTNSIESVGALFYSALFVTHDVRLQASNYTEPAQAVASLGLRRNRGSGIEGCGGWCWVTWWVVRGGAG